MQLHGAWQVHEAAARGLDATVVVRVDAVVRTEHVRVRHRPGVVAGLIPSPPVGGESAVVSTCMREGRQCNGRPPCFRLMREAIRAHQRSSEA